MHILLLAPHPFFQERGTPIAVRMLAETLAGAGHRIELLAYGEGDDVPLPRGVTLHRAVAPGMRGIRPGLSLKKLIGDAFMWPRAVRLARERRVAIVHAVEEAVFMAMHIRRRLGIPYVFDMDSSMPRQIVEKYPWFAPLAAPMVACERRAIRGARAVVAVCEYLAAIAREAGARRVTVLRDVPLNAAAGASAAAPDPLPGASPRFLYVGNLEAYQGVDLMLDAFTCHVRAGGQGSLVIVGGGDALPAYRGRVAARGLSARVRMPGPRPLAALAATLRQADILVSPRIRGGNTPMKIYSYLASERPVLATRIAAHTEVMDDTMGVLCEPTVPAMAAAMRGLADDPARRRNLGARAARIAREQFSPEAYRRILLACYDELAAPDKEGVVE